MLKLLERTLVNRAYQLTRTLLFPARAETVESTSSTVEDGGRECLWSGCEPKPVSADQIHSTHGAQSLRAHETASSIVCGSQVHMAAGISTRNRATMEKSSLLLKLKACAGQRVTLFESLDWKTPCLMHTLANQLRSSQKNTWASYVFVDGRSLSTIKSWHNSFLKSAWRDHTLCSVQIVTKSTQLLGTVVRWKYIHTRKNIRI